MSRTAIQTYSGRSFDILNPGKDSICIEDIAHHLSQINRFNGATNIPYNVCEHSVNVSLLVSDEFKLEALLHDASEAYIGDCCTPLKQSVNMDGYRDLEESIQKCCEYTFGVMSTEESHAEVKKADTVMLKVEAMWLLRHPLIKEWSQWIDSIEIPETTPTIIGWEPSFSKMMFLKTFNELTKK